ncbi:hypothetical protein HanRHA438_Chr17g0793441 [Helianthus annuus]|nr:hypothetical protein HanRHA438_Chr17g0793441 [Helianthus annuus]
MRSLQFCCFLLIIGCLVSQIYASSYAAILYDKFFFEGSQIVSEKGDRSGKIIVTIRLRLISDGSRISFHRVPFDKFSLILAIFLKHINFPLFFSFFLQTEGVPGNPQNTPGSATAPNPAH